MLPEWFKKDFPGTSSLINSTMFIVIMLIFSRAISKVGSTLPEAKESTEFWFFVFLAWFIIAILIWKILELQTELKRARTNYGRNISS